MKNQFNYWFALLFLALPLCTFAQEVPKETPKDTVTWTKGGSVSLAFANVGLSNWTAGGQNSISIGTIIEGKLTRTTLKSIWEIYGNLSLGGARVGDENVLFKKTDDILVFGSKYAYKLSENWSIPINLELRTQFLDGYAFKKNAITGKEEFANKISGFMAPGYLFSGVGIQYKNKKFDASLLPVSNRTIFVLDDILAASGAYAEKNAKITPDLGITMRVGWEISPMKNITFKTNAMAFSKYADLARIDLSWDALIVMQVNKYINTSFGTNLIYYNDAKIAQTDGSLKQYLVQFKHVLNVNVGIKF